jgi:hypothetical protein
VSQTLTIRDLTYRHAVPPPFAPPSREARP